MRALNADEQLMADVLARFPDGTTEENLICTCMLEKKLARVYRGEILMTLESEKITRRTVAELATMIN